MHTSYFGNIKNLPKGKTIAICQGIPGWYKGQRCLELAPSWTMIKLKEAAEYDRQYADILSKLTPGRTYETLEAMVGGPMIRSSLPLSMGEEKEIVLIVGMNSKRRNDENTRRHSQKHNSYS